MALSSGQIKEILVLVVAADKVRSGGGKGQTNKQIASEVIGNPKAESTIRRIRKEFYKNNKYRGITLEQDVVVAQEEKCPFSIEPEILETLCESQDFNVSNLAKRLRTAQKTNNQLRKIQREMFDSEGDVEYDFASVMEGVVKDLVKVKVPKTQSSTKNNKRTVEILFSDLQIGKITEHYNTDVAICALKYYGEEVLKKVQQVKPERIIFAALGDNAEDNMKHGIQSAISTDTSNAEQLTNCIREVWKSVLLPLFSLGIPVDFHGIQGNHLSSTIKGMGNFYEGRQGWDYAIYSAWKLLAETSGFDHVTFTIPEGIFGTYDIYGKKTVYEHGYELKGQGEGAMQKLKEKRMNNTKQWIDRIVIGDRHHSEVYGCGDFVLNGAFFGIARQGVEYSGNLGFNSNPMQTILVHEPTDLPNVSTVVGIHCVQIVKGYGL